MKPLRINRLVVVSFVNGMSLMVFELVAARLLAPTIGSSTYIWTSVIGVIIAMLALGSWLGGRLADLRKNLLDIAFLLLFAAFSIAVVAIFASRFFDGLSQLALDMRLKGVIASLVLFAPTSFLVGVIGPYLAKLNVRSLEYTGRSVANLDAMNALGGIFGTFLTGFVLFSLVGSWNILWLLGILLVGLSWMIMPSRQRRLRLLLSLAVVCAPLITVWPNVLHVDTATAHYVIADITTRQRKTRVLMSGPGGYQSGVDLDATDDLVFWYTKAAAEATTYVDSPRRILVLGGGAFTLPRALAAKYPEATIDVVEIDPELEKIAKDHFFYTSPANVRVIADDARVFVDTTKETYDVVIVDVYTDDSVPFTVLTKEYAASLGRIVRPHGIAIANVIASQDTCQPYFVAAATPYMDAFGHGWFAAERPSGISNHVMLFSRRDLAVGAAFQPFDLPAQAPRYSDNFAPAEALQHGCH
ncbi:MAG: fused MFS/spermidine synthase [Acidobacteriota bacterium]